MEDFQKKVEETLHAEFDNSASHKQDIRRIAEQASNLRTNLDNSGKYDLELTIELINKHLSKRSEGTPKWAWNNWVGSLEFVEAVPEGYQI